LVKKNDQKLIITLIKKFKTINGKTLKIGASMKTEKILLVDSKIKDSLTRYLYRGSPPFEKIDELERLIKEALSRNEDPDILANALSKLVQDEKELLLSGVLLFYHYKATSKRPKAYKSPLQKQSPEEKIREFHIRGIEQVKNPMFSPTYKVKVNEEPSTIGDFAIIAVKAYYEHLQNSSVSILGLKKIGKKTFMVSTDLGELRVDGNRSHAGYLYTPDGDIIKFIVSL